MIEESERLITAQTVDDDPQERAMRPKLLEEYRGQPVVAEQMQIFISAALACGCSMEVKRAIHKQLGGKSNCTALRIWFGDSLYNGQCRSPGLEIY